MPKRVNLIGQVFGRLTVVKKAETKCTGGKTMYICICDCTGVEITVRGTNLTTGRSTSCGCQKSIGEENIVKALIKDGKKYEREYSFANLSSVNKLRFDFAIMTDENELDYLLEFDGIQHTIATGHGWNTTENLIETQARDKMKNDYCKKRGIPLIRIPYTERDNITIDMIRVTSPYLM